MEEFELPQLIGIIIQVMLSLTGIVLYIIYLIDFIKDIYKDRIDIIQFTMITIFIIVIIIGIAINITTLK